MAGKASLLWLHGASGLGVSLGPHNSFSWALGLLQLEEVSKATVQVPFSSCKPEVLPNSNEEAPEANKAGDTLLPYFQADGEKSGLLSEQPCPDSQPLTPHGARVVTVSPSPFSLSWFMES